MASADLYIDEINLLKYIDKTECLECGFSSCEEFVKYILNGKKKPEDCPFITKNKAYAIEVLQKIKDLWPDVPLLLHPRPAKTGLLELNNPTPNSLVLITGNNEYTQQVFMTVMSTTLSPFFILFIDTDGNTIDMSMIFNTFTPQRIKKALKDSGLEKSVDRRELIIPGLAFPIREDIEKITGWKVRVGPKCVAELPLFLSEIWIPP